jgi:ribosomal protein S18 acetylase RimI-like enzyme
MEKGGMFMIERATEKDKQFISTRAAESASEGAQQPLSAEKANSMFDSIVNKGGYYLVYRNADRSIAGWILLGENTDYFSDKKFGFIYDIYVLPEYRGRGISKEFIQEGISTLKTSGYEEVRLNVFATNHAKEIYKKFGFKDLNSIMTLAI